MSPPSSRSGMAPRPALLCWGRFVVLRSPPSFSRLRDLCTSTSRLTPLSGTTALKSPMALPWRVRLILLLSSLLAKISNSDCPPRIEKDIFYVTMYLMWFDFTLFDFFHLAKSQTENTLFSFSLFKGKFWFAWLLS